MRATIGVLRTMGWNAGCRLGEGLGVLGYRPFGIRKRVVEKQIAAAFPELSDDAVKKLARESYAHLGRTFAESALFDMLGKDGVLNLVDEAKDWHHVDEAMAAGKGIVFVTGHIGNWELAGAYVAARGVPDEDIFSGMVNPLTDAEVSPAPVSKAAATVQPSLYVKRVTPPARTGR